jgi:hypothetical protein
MTIHYQFTDAIAGLYRRFSPLRQYDFVFIARDGLLARLMLKEEELERVTRRGRNPFRPAAAPGLGE